MRKIAIFGAGGMGREVACIIRRINEVRNVPQWDFIGFYDDGIPAGTQTDEGVVLGGIKELNEYNSPLNVVIAIGNPKVYKKIRDNLVNPKISYRNIIDPTVEFWDINNYVIGEGNIICPHCTISCNVTIGNYNILNGDISLRHDVRIGSYNAIMPGVRISGGVVMGNGVFIGLNAAVAQYLKVADNVRIGAGSILLSDTEADAFYTGVPAKKHTKEVETSGSY